MSVFAIHSDGSPNDIINIFWHVFAESSSLRFRVVEDVNAKEKSLWHFYVYVFAGKSRTQRGVILLQNVKFLSRSIFGKFSVLCSLNPTLPSAELQITITKFVKIAKWRLEVHPPLHRFVHMECWYSHLICENLFFHFQIPVLLEPVPQLHIPCLVKRQKFKKLNHDGRHYKYFICDMWCGSQHKICHFKTVDSAKKIIKLFHFFS